jgi:molybdopterin-guanine dinucleotide biosynthesis protein
MEQRKVKLSTAVLAGGKSRRTNGKNKSFLMYENKTFIDRILGELSAFDEVLISVGNKKEYSHLPYALVVDEFEDIGPLGGIHACLKQCRNEFLFVCATDMPGLRKELIKFMSEFISSDYDCFVLTSDSNVQPLCTIYRKSLIPLIEELFLQNRYSPLAVFDNSRVKYIPLESSCFDESVIVNINYLSDMGKLHGHRPDMDELKPGKPHFFAVSGIKNSGKTTLIEKLITAFKTEGLKVGVIKHDGHDFELDLPDTDTYRLRQAGSNPTAIYSQTKFAIIQAQEDICMKNLLDYFSDCDILIVEGLKDSDLPKIEVVIKEPQSNEKNLMAVVTDGDFLHKSVPTLKRNAIFQLVEIVKKHFDV